MYRRQGNKQQIQNRWVALAQKTRALRHPRSWSTENSNPPDAPRGKLKPSDAYACSPPRRTKNSNPLTEKRQKSEPSGARIVLAPEGSSFLSRQPYPPKGSTFSISLFRATKIRPRVRIFGRRGPSPEGWSFCWHANLILKRVPLFCYAAKGFEFFSATHSPNKGFKLVGLRGLLTKGSIFCPRNHNPTKGLISFRFGII